MKTTRISLLALGLLVGTLASNLSAQNAAPATRPMAPATAQPVRQGAGSPIAVIDISRIFKEYPAFIDEMERLKRRVEDEDAKMKLRANELQADVDVLKSLKAGSPEYKTKEKDIAEKRAQMNIDVQVQRKEFLQQEAAIYHEVYERVRQEVNAFATQVGLAAVIRYSGEVAEADQPDQVLRQIQKDLVWFNPGLDITNQILANLNARGGAPTQRTGIPYPASNPSPNVPYRR